MYSINCWIEHEFKCIYTNSIQFPSYQIWNKWCFIFTVNNWIHANVFVCAKKHNALKLNKLLWNGNYNHQPSSPFLSKRLLFITHTFVAYIWIVLKVLGVYEPLIVLLMMRLPKSLQFSVCISVDSFSILKTMDNMMIASPVYSLHYSERCAWKLHFIFRLYVDHTIHQACFTLISSCLMEWQTNLIKAIAVFNNIDHSNYVHNNCVCVNIWNWHSHKSSCVLWSALSALHQMQLQMYNGLHENVKMLFWC